MRYLLSILVITIVFISCEGSEVKTAKTGTKRVFDSANFTSIKWIDSLKDLGEVPPGKIAEIKFKFKNTGEKPLLILAAKPGCGCTVADYPKEPIAPGKEGELTANYDVSKGGAGEFRKNIKVTTNTKGSTETYIFFFGKIKQPGDSSTVKKQG